MQGLLIATYIKEVVLEMQQDREEKAQVREKSKRKVFPNLLGKNLTYLLRLFQVA